LIRQRNSEQARFHLYRCQFPAELQLAHRRCLPHLRNLLLLAFHPFSVEAGLLLVLERELFLQAVCRDFRKNCHLILEP